MHDVFTLNSQDNTIIKGHKWLCKDKPKAIVVICHGMAEHIMRYHHVCLSMNAFNISCYGYAHRGHFDNILSLNHMGVIGSDGWQKMCEDTLSVLNFVKKHNVDTPLILLGHSMGAFIAQDILMHHSTLLDGLILSSTGYQSKFSLKLLHFYATASLSSPKKEQRLNTLNKLMWWSLNVKFFPWKTAFEWISSQRLEIDAYNQDPWCGTDMPAEFYKLLSENIYRIMHEDTLPSTNLPILFIAGSQDPVVGYKKGVYRIYEKYLAHGLNASLKCYMGCRHELFNDFKRERVLKDVSNWILNL